VTPEWFPSADTWAAWAQCITVGVAAWALVYASRQVREARETRERMVQPNVVVYIDHNPNSWQHLDLVIKNFGETAAYNIEITVPPYPIVPYKRASEADITEFLQFPSYIGILAPGQAWRTVIESAVDRKLLAEPLSDNDIVGHVSFTAAMIPDPNKEPFRNPIWLDPKMFKGMLRVPPDNAAKQISDKVGEVADALREGL
jgi:hypothetical protein